MTSPVHDRRRPLTSAELTAIPWLAMIEPEAAARAVGALRLSRAERGDIVCRVGRPITYWFGLVDGLLKVGVDTAQGRTTTYTGIAPGGWFGEGTALKREPYRYDVQALRSSRVVGLPVDTFHWLIDHSIGFNRFILGQLNERLGQFMGTLAAERTSSQEQRVAHSIAALTNPVLFPGVGKVLRITQQELAYLVGLSRQRVNQALRELELRGVMQVVYGGLRILDLETLAASDAARRQEDAGSRNSTTVRV